MIDFHTHILFRFDDGPKDAATSLEMLKKSRRQGITRILSTSHCYPRGEESVERFIERRNRRLTALKQEMNAAGGVFPEIIAASEVNLYTDISDYSNLEPLCIDGTNYILLEMPYGPWKDWMYDCVYRVTLRGLRPVIAHIDRYLDRERRELAPLFDLNVLYQVNADAFLSAASRKRMVELFAQGHAHVLGSDMHNLDRRKSNLKEAAGLIQKKLGREYLDYLMENSAAILKNRPVDKKAYQALPKPKKSGLFG